MKKLWLIRKDQEAVSPVIATILMVAITVVLAAVLYVMVSGLLGGGSTTTAKSVGLSPQSGATNWTLLVSSVSTSGISLTGATFSIFDQNGNPKLSSKALSDLALPGSWTANKVTYLKKGAEADIVVGARLNIDKVTYPANYKYELADATSILATGTLQG